MLISYNTNDGITIHNRFHKIIFRAQCQKRLCCHYIQKEIACFYNIKSTSSYCIIKFLKKALGQNSAISAFTHINKIQFSDCHQTAKCFIFSQKQCFHAITSCRYCCGNPLRFCPHHNDIILFRHIYRIFPYFFFCNLFVLCLAACHKTAQSKANQNDQCDRSFFIYHIVLPLQSLGFHIKS